jgi:dihydroflavonol-4-reductase
VRTRPGHAAPGVELVELDLLELDAKRDVVAGVDLVIHAAAILRARTPAERALQERVNVEVTRALVEACRDTGVRRLVHIGSTATLGISERPETPADEASEFNLAGFGLDYNETKLQADRLVLSAAAAGLETVVVSPGFTFGRWRDGYRGGEVVERVLQRRVVPCTRGGLSIVHVEDLVDGIRRAAAAGRAGHRYVLSGPNASFHEIARAVARLSGERRLVLTVPDVVRDLAGWILNSERARRRGRAPLLFLNGRYAYQYYSSEKARRELGYEPRGLDAIIADALAHLRGP